MDYDGLFYYFISVCRRLQKLPGLDQTAMRDAIVNERVHEFAFEQVLYPELRRKSTFNGTPDYLGDFITDFSDL